MKIIISLILISLLNPSAFAGVEQISIQDFSFHYDGHNGQGNFSKVALNTDTIDFNAEDYHVDLIKHQNHMIIAKADTKVKLQTVEGDMLSSLGQIVIDDLSVNIIQNRKLSIALTRADIEIGDGTHQFNNLRLKCLSSPSRNGDVLSFLLPCMKNGYFSIPEIALSKESKSSMIEAFAIETFILKYLNESEDFKPSGLAPKKLKDIKLKVTNNNFTLNAKVKILFNLKVKGAGKIYYHTQNSELEIYLDKIKVGFIGITNKVLKAVKKANMKNVRVSGHSIFVSL
jgi:hypothetical protein